ncbi:MAG: hypothetical protein LIP23_06075 [Planctomycetes bacterium]|nr:hypothetical protein [Planctomycetota bacterium]
MKNIYINSRLHPLQLAYDPCVAAKTWIWSAGERWLLLTPPRLNRLAKRLGLDDARVEKSFSLIKRNHPYPELYCRALGVEEVRYISPKNYPDMFCPRCHGMHKAHPEDVGALCAYCRGEKRRDEEKTPGTAKKTDTRTNRRARLRVLAHDSLALDAKTLCPNPRYNRHRQVVRDWNMATQRILNGETYRDVSRDLKCSVGLLHKKVKQRSWMNN